MQASPQKNVVHLLQMVNSLSFLQFSKTKKHPFLCWKPKTMRDWSLPKKRRKEVILSLFCASFDFLCSVPYWLLPAVGSHFLQKYVDLLQVYIVTTWIFHMKVWILPVCIIQIELFTTRSCYCSENCIFNYKWMLKSSIFDSIVILSKNVILTRIWWHISVISKLSR